MRQRGDQVLTQIFRLNHENAEQPGAGAAAFDQPQQHHQRQRRQQTLVITDYADNLQRIGQIIAALDNPASGTWKSSRCKHAVAATWRLWCSAWPLAVREPGAVHAVRPAPGGSGMSVMADPRSNSLMVRASNPARLAAARGDDRQAGPATAGPAAALAATSRWCT